MSIPETIVYIDIFYKLSTDRKLSTEGKKRKHIFFSILLYHIFFLGKEIYIYDLKVQVIRITNLFILGQIQ
jgi:hypothetical protein